MTKPIILIVEDNLSTRKMMRVVLSAEGYTVLEAENGSEALDYMQRTSPQLIFQDLTLPDMDGIELNKQLRKLPNGANIPIIALTGFLNKINIDVTGQNSFTMSLIKPVDPALLKKTTQAHLHISDQSLNKTKINKRILLVDDDSTQLKLFNLYLTKVGFNVDTANDGEEALQKAITNCPDAIVSDVLLPKLDGFELCHKLRHLPQFANTPIILLSSQYLEQADQELAKKAGANEYITRTSDPKKLIKSLLNNLADSTTSAATSDDSIGEEHLITLRRQLEKQINSKKELMESNALKSAQLALLSGIADELTKHTENLDIILNHILTIALDATGISNGLLYLKEKGNTLVLKQFIGYTDEEVNVLKNFGGDYKTLIEIIKNGKVITIPQSSSPTVFEQALLRNSNIKSGLIIPLLSNKEHLGIIFLGSQHQPNHQLTKDFMLFAQTLGKQISQSIELATTFKKLTISENRYRTLMDKASCGIFISDLEGNILEVNHHLEELFGCSRPHIIGKKFKDFMLAKDHHLIAVLMQKLLLEKSIGPNEGSIKQENGSIREIEYSAAFINLDEENLLLAILNDITERNQLRSQRLLSDKLAIIGTLSTGILHEINNPVTWLLTNLKYLLKKNQTMAQNILQLNTIFKETKDDQAIQGLLEKIQQNTQELSEMIYESKTGAEEITEIVKNLKGFARIDDESANKIDIHDILNSAIKLVQHEFKYRAKLVTDFDTNIPPSLLMRSKLQQVFLNLIVNAAQAMPERNIEKNIITIKTSLKNKIIKIEFKDSGMGIPPHVLSKIFEPFFTTKPTGVGTGLGLSICQEIIRNLGGDIIVESIQGKGSTFTVLVPLHEETTPTNHVKADSFQNANILLIDDEPSLLKTMQQILHPHHKVTSALGGRVAFDILANTSELFDVIICDLNMPDINGLDLYRYIFHEHKGLQNRMIFITGGVDKTYQTFLNNIPNLCIEKPFTEEDLLDAINQVMEVIDDNV